ncbi:hypothetical protein RAG66_12950 [Klebsiella quasipneumoniae subsp. similipneumoniae]
MSEDVKLMEDSALESLIASRESESEPPGEGAVSIPPSSFNGEFVPD